MSAIENLRLPPKLAAAGCGLLMALSLWPIATAVSADNPAPAAAQRQTVEVVVDYGDGAEIHFTAIPWKTGLKALDALAAAADHPHGVKYKSRGAGSNLLVTQIGDLKNEGGGAKSRNWIYQVDGQQAEVGVGAQRVEAGSVVLWKFEVADYNR